jgi:hypothetical protein
MAKKSTGPSKSDLLTILRNHERRVDPKVAKAEKTHQERERAVESFLRHCRTYQRLKQQCEGARMRLYRLRTRISEEAKQARASCYNDVRLYGPTPAVVRKIEKFLKRYP